MSWKQLVPFAAREDTMLGEVLVCFSLAAPSATLVAEHSDVCLGSGWKDNALLFP